MKQKYAIVIDLGSSNVRVALVSRNGKILQKVSEPTNREGKSGTAVTKQIIRLARSVSDNENSNSLAGISIASMGPLDHIKGRAENAPNVPYPYIPLVRPMEKAFGRSVLLFKDTHAGVLGEKYFGDGKRFDNIVYITISSGIGGGAIIDGRLLLGKSKNASEIGHLSVDTKYQIPCTCGKGIGHWEGIASGMNIPRFLKIWAEREHKNIPPFQEAKLIFQEAKRGNNTVLEFLEELSKLNAHAISDIIVAYDPELITIGGSVALNNQNIIIRGIKKYVDHYLEVPKIQITKLG
ncbi:MAG: ROK family protein, partial [Patescibacteria group bacterium]